MTKHFCDICQKELEYENSIQVNGWFHYQNSSYCVTCFQNKKNWSIIQRRLVKKTIANTPKSSKIALL